MCLILRIQFNTSQKEAGYSIAGLSELQSMWHLRQIEILIDYGISFILHKRLVYIFGTEIKKAYYYTACICFFIFISASLCMFITKMCSSKKYVHSEQTYVNMKMHVWMRSGHWINPAKSSVRHQCWLVSADLLLVFCSVCISYAATHKQNWAWTCPHTHLVHSTFWQASFVDLTFFCVFNIFWH